MPSIVIFLLAAIFLFQRPSFVANQQYQTIRDASKVAAADSLLLTFNSVRHYAESNPTRTGIITPDLWPAIMPVWYTGGYSMQGYTENGRAYVWTLGSQANYAHAGLAEQGATARISIGTAKQSMLINTITGPTGITLPGTIPDGALVYAG